MLEFKIDPATLAFTLFSNTSFLRQGFVLATPSAYYGLLLEVSTLVSSFHSGLS